MTGEPSPRDPARVLVVGYGNALRSDDGVGWHAARLLAGDARLAGIAVVAEHQLAPELAFDMSRAGLVILVDASTTTPAGTVSERRLAAAGEGSADRKPGSTRPSRGAPRPSPGSTRPRPGATSHHVDPELLLALALELYGSAPEAVVVSVGVAEMGPGVALTPSVAAALPVVADAVARLVAEHQARIEDEARERA